MDQAALENRLRKLAGEMPYPPTPDIAPLVRPHPRKGIRSRLPLRLAAGAALTIVLLAAALFAVPSVRAEIVRFIQIGVVRIFTAAPDETPLPTRPACTRDCNGQSKPGRCANAGPAAIIPQPGGRDRLTDGGTERGFSGASASLSA